MKTRFVRRAVAFGALSAMFAVAFAATKPPVKGVSYRIRMTTRLPAMMAQMQNGNATGPAVIAKVRAVGKKARFEFLTAPEGSGIGLEDYVLMLDSGRTVMVNVEAKEYSEAPAALGGGGGGLGMISQIAGASRRAGRSGQGGNIPQMEITGIDMDVQQLDGDTLQGRQVRHYQLVAEMNIQVMNNLVPLRIEAEYWTADLPYSIVNPFDLTGTVSADDPAAKLTARLLEARKKIQGTPIKTTMTFTISGLGNGAMPPLEFTQTTQITDIKDMDVDLKDLEIPPGFTKKVVGGPGGPGGIR